MPSWRMSWMKARATALRSTPLLVSKRLSSIEITASLTIAGIWFGVTITRLCWLTMPSGLPEVVEQDRALGVLDLRRTSSAREVRGDGHEHAEHERDQRRAAGRRRRSRRGAAASGACRDGPAAVVGRDRRRGLGGRRWLGRRRGLGGPRRLRRRRGLGGRELDVWAIVLAHRRVGLSRARRRGVRLSLSARRTWAQAGPTGGESLALATMSDATAAGAADPVELAGALARNAVDSLPEGALADKLATARREGRQLRVKLGIDPTAPGHPPGPRRRAAQAARVPGRRPPGRADHRRLHRARGRPVGALEPAPDPLERGDRAQRRDVPGTGSEDPRRRSPRAWRCGATASGWTCRWSSCSSSCARRPRRSCSSATTSPNAGPRGSRSRCSSCSTRSSQGYDSVAVRCRRRARGHRPEVQPAARARHPARLRPARAGDHDDADPGGDRRRAQDVQVARQPDRRDRRAARRYTARR